MRPVAITVSKGDRKGFVVRVNGLQIGIEYSSHRLANKEATGLKDSQYPQATLYLWTEVTKSPNEKETA